MRFQVFLLFSSLSILSCINFCVVSGQCLQDQKSLLLQLKQSISFSPFATSNLTSWDTSTDCCSSWDGIKCDGSGHVIGLDLYSKFIYGVQNWTTLFELKYLESLNLSYNSFNSTPIPSGFDRLANLTHLNLSNAGFGGQIPIEVSRLKRLVSLDLSTLFSVPLRLVNPNLTTFARDLSELRELYLDGVNITMRGIEWSQALSSLPKLQVLSLSNCQLSGPFDQSILKLQSLSKLRLDFNKISDQVPEFLANFSNLSFLSLSSCGLQGKFPEKIFQLTQVQSLDVSANPCLRGSLPEFPQNGSLQNLVLSGSNFSGNLPESIGNLRFLCKLELPSCGFSGSIPTSFSKLTHLQYLDLSINNFNGSIPNLGSSVNLTKINLAHNRLSGPISSSRWDSHKNLASLNFRNNSLNGTIPQTLFMLPLLQTLDLSQNRFTGQLGEFPKDYSLALQTFDVSNNMLEGLVPSSIFDVSNLKILTLSSNNFNGTLQLDRFQNLKSLSSLDLSGNKLTINSNFTNSAFFPQLSTLKLGSCNLRTFPGFLSHQSMLTTLDLSNNQIRGKIPNWIGKIGNGSLMYLNLSFNKLESPDQSLSKDAFNSLYIVDLHSNLLHGSIPILPPSASVLDYSNNNISSTIPENTSSYLESAIFFSLSNNSFRGEIPSSICNAQYLQVLDLSNNSLSGHIPTCLGGNSNLKVLNLRSNKLIGIIPRNISGKCSLRTLDLNGNVLEGEVPQSLANCKTLEVLDLGNNNITGPFPCWLGEMSHLRVLVLRANKFSGLIPDPVNNTFQALQIIDLSSNQFTGKLPSTRFKQWEGMKTEKEEDSNYKHNILKYGFLELSHLYYQDAVTVTSKGQQMELVKILTIFTSIDLSNNKFDGEIPEGIGNLTALYVLNLSSNALSGSIPPSLGKLKQLESLDLSNNNLRGVIPSQLGDLTFLSVLNLSFNQLVGRIPKGSQLQNMDQCPFEGNAGLCGPPLTKSCTGTDTAEFVPPIKSSKPAANLDWQFIVTGLGFGGGAAWIIAPLWFWTEGRKWYDKHIERLLLFLFPSTVFLSYACDDGRVDAVTDESSEDEYTDDEFTEDTIYYNDDGKMDGNSIGGGRYCVLCTKIDIRTQRPIHNPKCNHFSPHNSSFL